MNQATYQLSRVSTTEWESLTLSVKRSNSPSECALKCSADKVKGLPCQMFKHQGGECAMTGDLLYATSEDDSVAVYRDMNLGKSAILFILSFCFNKYVEDLVLLSTELGLT